MRIKYIIMYSQAFDEQFMNYSTFCVHRGGNKHRANNQSMCFP